jgi:hypothetical protein
MIIEAQPRAGVTGSRAWNFDDYAFGGRRKRLEPPMQIGGTTRNAFVAIGRDYASFSVNPMTSFNIGFDELLPGGTSRAIMKAFYQLVTIGLDPTDILWLGALHKKENDGKPSTDMHPAFINLLLKPETRWNPYVEKKDRALFTAFTELVNYQFNLASAKDPKRRRLASSPPKPRDPEWLIKWKRTLTKKVELHARTQQFTGRDDFLRFIKTLDEVSGAWFDGKVIRAQVRKRVLPIMGPLASDWFYKEPDRFQRLTREEYERDLERGLEARKKAHEKLYKSSGRNQVLPWVQLFEIDLPEELQTKLPAPEADHGKDQIHRVLGIGKYAKSESPAIPTQTEIKQPEIQAHGRESAVERTSEPEPPQAEAVSIFQRLANKTKESPNIQRAVAALHEIVRNQMTLQKLLLELAKLSYLEIDEEEDCGHKLRIQDSFRQEAKHLTEFRDLEDTVEAANSIIRNIINRDRAPEVEIDW